MSESKAVTRIVKRVEAKFPIGSRVVDPVIDAVPWARPAVDALQLTRQARFARFLRALDRGENDLSEKEREKLNAWVDTEIAQELLADYVERVVRTSSRIAAAALGLLYARRDDEAYPLRFRVLACEVLDGISDNDVEAFIALGTLADERVSEAILSSGDELPTAQMYSRDDGYVRGFGPRAGPYRVVAVEPQVAADRIGASPADAFAVCERLQTRSLLLRDFVNGPYGGSSYLTFGLSVDHERFMTLLTRAHGMLTTETPS